MVHRLETKYGVFLAKEHKDMYETWYEMYRECGEYLGEFCTISLADDTDEFVALLEEWLEENNITK